MDSDVLRHRLPIPSEQQAALATKRNSHRLVLETSFSIKKTISYGIILIAKNTQRMVMVQRKHTAELMIIIKGIYRVSQLPILIGQLVKPEAEKLRDWIEEYTTVETKKEELFLGWCKELGLEASDIQYAQTRFRSRYLIILTLLKRILPSIRDSNLKWSWPKGRMCFRANKFEKEIPLDCATREFTEEVELTMSEFGDPIYISNNYLVEIFYSVTGRIIESRYWIWIVADERPLPAVTENLEISDREWVSISECQLRLRNPDLTNQLSSSLALIDAHTVHMNQLTHS